MSVFPLPERLDKVIHERARLGIMASLAARDWMTFKELKAALDMTDGNLSVHARVLENSDYIKIAKRFVGRKPQTRMMLTRRGRRAFKLYLGELEQIVSIGKLT